MRRVAVPPRSASRRRRNLTKNLTSTPRGEFRSAARAAEVAPLKLPAYETPSAIRRKSGERDRDVLAVNRDPIDGHGVRALESWPEAHGRPAAVEAPNGSRRVAAVVLGAVRAAENEVTTLGSRARTPGSAQQIGRCRPGECDRSNGDVARPVGSAAATSQQCDRESDRAEQSKPHPSRSLSREFRQILLGLEPD